MAEIDTLICPKDREINKSESPLNKVTVLVVSLGGLIFGYDTGIMSIANEFVLEELAPNYDTLLKGFVTSIILFGAMAGSLFAGLFAAKFGRRISGFLGAGICLFGAITSAFSPHIAAFLVLRLILGIGVGLVGVICPMYASETAPENQKGRYGVLFQLTLTFGILISYVVGYICTPPYIMDKSIGWRVMVGSGGLFFALSLCIVAFFGMKDNTRFQEDRHKHSDNINSNKGPLGLFQRGKLGSTFLGVVLAATLQLTGINAIMYFGPLILTQAYPDAPPTFPYQINIAIGGWNFLATIIAILLVEKSRYWLMLSGTCILSVALLAVGFCFQFLVGSNLTIGVGISLFFFHWRI